MTADHATQPYCCPSPNVAVRAEPLGMARISNRGGFMRKLSVVAVLLALLVAACGGDTATDTTGATTADAPSEQQGGDGEPQDPPSEPEVDEEDDPSLPAEGSGASTNFCEFVSTFSDVGDAPASLNPADIEESFTSTAEAIEQSLDIAPSEVRDDVAMISEAYNGFVELLGEYDFDFLNMPEEATNDPRLTALDGDELQLAGDRIVAFCGLDPEVGDDDVSAGDGDQATGDLPAGFNAELVPPDGDVVVASESLSGTVVLIETQMSIDELVAFYTELLGAPLVVVDDPPAASWVQQTDDGILSVNVGIEDGVTQVAIAQTG